MHNKKRFLVLAVAAGVLSACSINQNPEGSYSGDDRVNLGGASQLLPAGGFVAVDLPALIADKTRSELTAELYKKLETNTITKGGKKKKLNSEMLGYLEANDYCSADTDADEDACIAEREMLSFAVQQYASYGADKQLAIRNRVQDRILSASTQRCNLYKVYLKRIESRNNFWLGTVTTVFGGAGAVFTSESASRILAGLAGVTSGVRAEFNQAYLANQATELIAKGIDLKRRGIKAEITLRQQESDVQKYSLFGALSDALEYHGACNILTGLEVAGKAVDNLEDPDFSVLTKNLYRSKHLEEVMDGTLPANFRYAELANETLAAVPEKTPSDEFRRLFHSVLIPDTDTPITIQVNGVLGKLVTDTKINSARQASIMALTDAGGQPWLPQLDTRLTKYRAAQLDRFMALERSLLLPDDGKLHSAQMLNKEIKQMVQEVQLVNEKLQAGLTLLGDAQFDINDNNKIAEVYQWINDAIPD
ncbi:MULTISPECIES: hypothetical protein [unclassified Pseudoalteromonas]|uniref:hypothetical protein n=1 Tax=unclassified Pseudoalteromonas TaxID=194690 RepID=UPI002096BB81|nr:hypothetical protein [Pseudoalteromonas sp. XMcav2-N]MCO7190827.1 hypothetical protein [Pseudoalteromonas sp. XMcav2-N]